MLRARLRTIEHSLTDFPKHRIFVTMEVHNSIADPTVKLGNYYDLMPIDTVPAEVSVSDVLHKVSMQQLLNEIARRTRSL